MIPLLVGANPRIVKQGPKVHIPVGAFHIIVEEHLDSTLFLYYEIKTEDGFSKPAMTQIHIDSITIINGPCKAMIVIEAPGKEPYLTIRAKRVSDDLIKSNSA